MKKILVTLMILALIAPAFAVSFTGTDLTGGKMRISYNVPAGETLRGVALKLSTTAGTATIAGTGDVTAIAAGFNTFIDYAFSTPVGYTVGAGHPLADPAAAGVLPLASFPASTFVLSMGALDQAGAQAGVTGAGTLCEIQYVGVAPSATIKVEADTLRGGAVVGDAVTQPAGFDVVVSFLPDTCNVSTPTLVKAVNDGFVNTDVTSITASATSDQGHALVYSFNWGAGYGANGAATQTNTYAFTAAGTESVTVIATCSVDGAVSAASAPMVLTREAVKTVATYYNDWKATTPLRTGRMACWAFKKQCKGDADGLLTGTAKAGYVAVYTADLTVLSGAWNIKEPATGTTPAGVGVTQAQICADFDHLATGTAKAGYVRVYTADLTLLSTNWNIKEPATGTTPTGPGIGNCPASNVNFYTN